MLRALALADFATLLLVACRLAGVVSWTWPVVLAPMLASWPVMSAMRLRVAQLEMRHAAVARLLERRMTDRSKLLAALSGGELSIP